MTSSLLFSPDDRHILVITGEQDESLDYAKTLTSELDLVEIIPQTNVQGFLGQELNAVIYDMHENFDPNSFGAITGTIRGGGFLILLKPTAFPKHSLFLQRFNEILEDKNQVHFLNLNKKESLILPSPPQKNVVQTFATADQEKAVAAIINVVKGHRNRPLVITSDRGRGKSAALGLAAAELTKQAIDNIIICAPSKKTADIVFKHAEFGFDVDTKNNNLKFYSPDELQQQKPVADLVLIDEAAAIPIPLLTSFLKQYSRIVFASTQHGYEGCGRGFAINFRKILDQETPEWKSIHLNTPIRWQENDTLEQFTFDALLLNAETVGESVINDASLSDCRFHPIDKQELLTNSAKLKTLFGLLVTAHYQTKPSDLLQLLDDDSVSIYCLEAKESIVAVALIIAEGNIETELSEAIFNGQRRIQGHLVAQSLSSNLGIESAPQLSGERISRIAVHPALQGKGLGSFLIQELIANTNADYLSTCYGATETLLTFWKKAGFSAVHLGIKRDASSGAHSVTMLHPKSEAGKKVTDQAQGIFSQSFPQLLTDVLNTLESEIVFALLPHPKDENQITKQITNEDKKRLRAFAFESRGFENSLYLLWKLVLTQLPQNKTLNTTEKKLLIIKVLQKQPWKLLVEKMGSNVTGKKEALTMMRQTIAKLL